MGIELPDYDYSNACSVCFAANVTPALVYVSVTGIKKGEHWGPSIAPPPNSMHALHNIGGCSWEKYSDPWTVRLTTGYGGTTFSIRHDHLGYAFYHGRSFDCAKYFVNSKRVPTLTEWWSGHAAVGWTAPLTGPSIQRVAALLNIKVEPKTFAEFFPVEENVNTYRFARKKDGTCVYIKFDYS